MTDTQTKNSVPQRIDAGGPIIGVVVHGRGAVITRRIEIAGELPTEPFDLAIGGITPLADPGSVRVTIPEEGRSLVGVNARMVVPSTDSGPGASTERVETLNRHIGRLHEREGALKERVKRLQDVMLTPMGKKSVKTVGPGERIEFALAVGEVISGTVESLDQRIIDLRVELERVTRERDAAQLEDMQTSGSDRMGDSHPSRTFDLRIAAGSQPLRTIEISYAVPYAAKWWPQYTLRLTEGGSQATLTMEALVAQRTGEDWEGVPIGLSTASIIFDATLPKLPSLRLGKRQPPESRGFREPPTGAERLFEGYDGFKGRLHSRSTPVSGSARVTMMDQPVAAASGFGGAAYHDLDEDTGSFDDMSKEEFAVQRAPAPSMASAPPGAPMLQQSMMAAPMKRRALIGMAAEAVAAPFAAAANVLGGMAEGYGGGGRGGFGPAGDVAAGHDPGDDWLEFDSLVMAGRDNPSRGRLTKRPAASGLPASELFDAQDSARRMNLTDPVVSRGLFDYRYDADGTARIPADGRLHRIEISQRPAPSHLEWRTVPLVDPAVYREAVLHNPFDSPLLAGPVDVFSEGQLVTTTNVTRVDSGGSMRVGLGVDDRIRIARNVRMVEESAGLLGGKRELIHDVEIEVRSGLGDEAIVEVIDRVPVTSDDHVDVDLMDEKPRGAHYDQKEHDHPIEGGRRWEIKLQAGARSTIEYRYRITLRSKDELVGGNRRG